MWFLLISIVSFELKSIQPYEMLPDSLLNRKQLCQINCTRNQTMSDKFQRIFQCSIGQYRICEAYLTIDYHTQLVSYSFTTSDAMDNSSVIRTELIDDYLKYFETDITAIRFRQLKMKFSKLNSYRLNIQYCKFLYFLLHFDYEKWLLDCRTQIDDVSDLSVFLFLN